MNILLNAVVFKIAWLSTIFGGANGLPLLGPLAVMAAVGIHLWRAPEPTRELTLVIMTGAIGFSCDSGMGAAGWLSYSSGTFVAGLAPYWILAMWMLFATTLNVTFRWLHNRTGLAAMMGAVFGPLSYFAGSAAGAVNIIEPAIVFTVLSVSWAILLPGLLQLARQLDGTVVPVINSRF